MPSLDSLLAAYRSDPTQQDALLTASTRYSRRVAAALGAAEPDDVAQLAALEVWKHSTRITGSVPAWLRTVTKRLVYREYARSSRRIATSAMPDNEEDEQEIAVVLDEDRPCRNPFRVTDPQLRVAAGLLIHGYNIKDSAEYAGLSVGQIQRRAKLPKMVSA